MNLAMAVEALRNGTQEVIVDPGGGGSMVPRVMPNQKVLVRKLDHFPRVGEVVLVTVHGKIYLHKVLTVQAVRVRIGNNHGNSNGWTSIAKVHGYVADFHPAP